MSTAASSAGTPIAHLPAAGTLEASQCGTCGYLHVPARQYRCISCGGRNLEARAVALRGTIETYTVLRGEPAVAVGLVRLDAGPLLTVSLDLAGPALRIGERVEGHPEAQALPEAGRTALRLRFRVVPGIAAAGTALAASRPEQPR